MGLHLCITNPDAFEVNMSTGVYGNVGNSGENPLVFWGKLRDLYILKPGDKVLFYIKERKELHGIFEVTSMPYLCSDDLFGNGERYPFRFNFRTSERYPNGIPSFEFYSLIENGYIKSVSSLERDIMASYRGIRQLRIHELDILRKYFKKYNPKTDYRRFEQIESTTNIETREAINFEPESLDEVDEPLELVFNRIPNQNGYARYEVIIQLYIVYNLLHDTNEVRSIFELTGFSELMLEAPIFKSMQDRIDILTLFGDSDEDLFYSFMELKRDDNIQIGDLSQLIGYLKSFASANSLSLNSYEGIYVSTRFRQEVKDYLEHRSEVEDEDIVRLISYSVDDNGLVSFNNLV